MYTRLVRRSRSRAGTPMVQYARDERGSSLLRTSLLLSAIIIVSNFLIGIFVPIVTGLDDEIEFFDMLWRVVVGQRVGIDYHNPLAIGQLQLAALLWSWLGPHYWVMRLAIALVNLLIAFC